MIPVYVSYFAFKSDFTKAMEDFATLVQKSSHIIGELQNLVFLVSSKLLNLRASKNSQTQFAVKTYCKLNRCLTYKLSEH